MINGSLAKRYARALLELASSPIQRDKFLSDLERFTAASKQDDALLAILGAKHHSIKNRKGIVSALARRLAIDPTVHKFLELLTERGRIGGITLITRHFRDLVDQAAGRVRASVRSAKPLGSADLQRITQALQQATSKQIILDTSVDPELIGGVVAQVGSYTLDRSVRTSLEQLRGSLRGD